MILSDCELFEYNDKCYYIKNNLVLFNTQFDQDDNEILLCIYHPNLESQLKNKFNELRSYDIETLYYNYFKEKFNINLPYECYPSISFYKEEWVQVVGNYKNNHLK